MSRNIEPDWPALLSKLTATARRTLFAEIRSDDEDVAHEAAAELLLNLPDFHKAKNPEAWARGIARNKARERNRAFGRERRIKPPTLGSFWTLVRERLDAYPESPKAPGACFCYRHLFMYGRKARVLLFEIDGPDELVRLFCFAANAAYHMSAKTRRPVTNFRVLLAWLANQFCDRIEIVDMPCVIPSKSLAMSHPLINRQFYVESVPQLAKRYSYPGGTAALRRLIRQFQGFRPEPAQFHRPIFRRSDQVVPRK